MATENINNSNYGDENIKTLEGVEHIRLRPGMYIGTLERVTIRLTVSTCFSRR